MLTTAFAGIGAWPGATTLFKWSIPYNGVATGVPPHLHVAPDAAICASVMSDEAHGTLPVRRSNRGVIVLGSPVNSRGNERNVCVTRFASPNPGRSRAKPKRK